MTSKDRHEARYQRRVYQRRQKEIERANTYTEWENIYGLTPLIKGYRQTSKASKNRNKTQLFMMNLVTNTVEQKQKLDKGTWRSKGFNEFDIMERGKLRHIQSVDISEKGIQNSLSNNCLIPILRPHLIYDNGASLKGKGTDFALNRFEEHLRWHYRRYSLEGGIYFFDFSGYFQNIDQEKLIEGVDYYIINNRVIQTFEMFVKAFKEGGLGLGSQVSQISAVFYPNKIDHFIKDKLGIHCYGRYMDDGYIIYHDIEGLKEIIKEFEVLCKELGITLNKKKCRIIKMHKQFIFLKTRFFITKNGKVVRRINRQMMKKERHRLKSFRKFYDMGLMSYTDVYNNFHSWLLSLTRGASYHIMENMIRYFNSLFPESPYRPIKIKERKHRVLLHLSKRAVCI